jgi:hypothetical protein
MSVAVTLSGTLLKPPAPGQPAASIPFSISPSIDNEAIDVLVFTGVAAETFDPGTLTTAKGFLLMVDAGTGLLPVTVSYGGESIIVSPGGFIAIGNPVGQALPVIVVTSAGAAKVRIWALG